MSETLKVTHEERHMGRDGSDGVDSKVADTLLDRFLDRPTFEFDTHESGARCGPVDSRGHSSK